MPPKKQKPRIEKIVENYFPVEEDLKLTTEKKVKLVPIIQEFKKSKEISVKPPLSREEFLKGSIEKEYHKKETKEIVEKLPTKKRKIRKSTKKKSRNTKIVKYSPEKITLKKSGYELIITEKPQAAGKIASFLGKSTQKTTNKVSYYEVKNNGKNIVVACAVGHLFTLKQTSSGSTVPIFDIGWVPNYLARKGDFTKRYYDLIKQLAKNAGEITIATDYDVEGEVIGLNVMRFICGQKDANRMKFSTLTEKEIKESYEKKFKKINWGQAIAGETRHHLDWFYGINLSRALMNAIKTTGSFRIMSIGRVQGPALKLIVDKEKTITDFKPEKYWQIFITIDDGKNRLELKHSKDIFDEEELKNFDNLEGKNANASTEKKQEILPPQPPFNLTNLQTEAYKFYGITPSNTLKAAQSLYLGGLISYPRTSSQKLPDSIDYKNILKIVSKKYGVENLIKRTKPIEGKKTDPAHPSIYPTGNFQILSGDEEKIYNLVARRFLSLFCEDAIIDKKKIKAITENNLVFSTNGAEINKKGWMGVYPSKLKENQIPDMEGKVKIINSKIEEKETQPPKRYSPASIISELEKRNLGTKATRSNILETLYDRGYVKNTSITATPLGISLIETLKKYSPIIIDEKLTRKFEKEMDSITNLKKDFEKEEKKIIEEAKKTITLIANDFEKKEKNIGKELLNAQTKQREQQKIENTLIQCPKCKKGNLAITYSRKNRKHFIACDAYPECKNTFSLPPNGIIKRVNKLCEKCGFPLLMSLRKGKKPWIFCFNSECETNKERLEEYRKKKEAENN
jgi:DNA topoisomerase I